MAGYYTGDQYAAYYAGTEYAAAATVGGPGTTQSKCLLEHFIEIWRSRMLCIES